MTNDKKNLGLVLGATVQYNELFKVLLLKFLISLCWKVFPPRVIWATFAQTDGCSKLLLSVRDFDFFKPACRNDSY